MEIIEEEVRLEENPQNEIEEELKEPFRPRHEERRIAVAIVGAKQIGKSMLVRELQSSGGRLGMRTFSRRSLEGKALELTFGQKSKSEDTEPFGPFSTHVVREGNTEIALLEVPWGTPKTRQQLILQANSLVDVVLVLIEEEHEAFKETLKCVADLLVWRGSQSSNKEEERSAHGVHLVVNSKARLSKPEEEKKKAEVLTECRQ